ncbi:hypothetical protein [Mycobacteroides abscessus]|uniref:hypothetical protein n=1 Tax=Mycobacteroides abscessus TaxID=36809 RepID=UPI001F3EE553|nr:hypothetical protein [Mycobacteroides abscessus]
MGTADQLRQRVMEVLRVRDETVPGSRNSPFWDATDIIETVLAFDGRGCVQQSGVRVET